MVTRPDWMTKNSSPGSPTQKRPSQADPADPEAGRELAAMVRRQSGEERDVVEKVLSMV